MGGSVGGRCVRLFLVLSLAKAEQLFWIKEILEIGSYLLGMQHFDSDQWRMWVDQKFITLRKNL